MAHTAWAKRMMTHPRVMAALAAEDLSESSGRAICQWTDKLPEGCRPAADAILLETTFCGRDLGMPRRIAASIATDRYRVFDLLRKPMPDS